MAGPVIVTNLRSAEDAEERGLLDACEATFNIDIERCEALPLRTVGDLYGVIRWKCQSERLGPSTAAVAQSYRLLRAHFAERGVKRLIRPTSPIAALLGPDPRADWALLRHRFGKRLPRLELSDGQLVFTAILVALGLAGGIFGGLTVSDATGSQVLGVATGLLVLGVMLAAVTLYSLFYAREIPFDLRTLADLARAVASQGASAPVKPALWQPRQAPALWDALEEILKRDGGIKGPVTADLKLDVLKKASAA